MEASLASTLAVTAVLWALGLPQAAAGSKPEWTAARAVPDLSCLDSSRIYDHHVWSQQPPVNHLFCPLDEPSLQLLQSIQDFNLQWRKDCHPLNLSTQGHLHSTQHTNGTAYLTFLHPQASDAGNYTCTLYLGGQRNASFTTKLTMIDLCTVPPEVLSPSSSQTLEPTLGSQITLNCTVRLPFDEHCNPILSWMKDGHWLGNESSQYTHEEKAWRSDNASEMFMSSLLSVNLTSDENYGVFACLARNITATFTLQRSEAAGHVGAVLAALAVLALLLFVAMIYVKCRLNMLLWYRNHYGELELNDGKLYDAYVSYMNSSDDRKFVNFIVKPQLENRYGYKLFLDDKTILPNSEPSADLIMNVSRCRRLIVVLSNAYLEQDWCNNNFREGLWRLMELSQRPIFIVFQTQYREIVHPAINLLKQHKKAVTLLLWQTGSMTPSSDFWKELCLALPRKVSFQHSMGDPQTQLQEDKDPMLILHSSYLEHRREPHPEGDPGLQGPIFRGPPTPRVTGSDGPTALAGGTMEEVQLSEGQRNEIDVSDLGSRNYGARTDFYCLVTEDDL
ncbi:PREDICTED: single Ig IL-1-related receptor isoform X1 [Gavialis gangeticus]|uniref:single Ig IL-1-related receptor isoform X1 n=1 Tax=Gavialis gangeticus TaxID=94835 RepID=UPI00092F47A6|nr:PREDICTED: single Ig IL-1-related receptor isoform X1 [Gavialis gangeticus]